MWYTSNSDPSQHLVSMAVGFCGMEKLHAKILLLTQEQ